MLRSLLFVAIALVLMMLVSAAVGFVTYQRRLAKLRTLAASRQNTDSWAHFRADFPDLPEAVLKASYDGLILLTGLPGFPLLPDDRLVEDLDIDPENSRDLMERLIEVNGGNYAEASKKMAAEPFHTARDMINWIGTATQIEDKHGPDI